MTVTINGTTGIAGVDGSAATPAMQGADTNTGVFYGTDIVGISTGGTERMRINASGQAEFAAGTAALPAIVTTGDTNTGIFFPAADTIAFAEGGTEAMRINSSGNVGIGTTTPAEPLSVIGQLSVSGASGGFLLRSRNTNASSSQWYSPTVGSTRLYDTANSVDRLSVDSSGNFGFNSGYGSAAVAYGCRAWVNFNGTGTIAIRDSGNVSSIADNGLGLYTINIDTDMPDVNYSVVLTPNQSTAGTNGLTATNILTQTVGVITISNGDTSGNSYIDSSIICAAIFR